VSDIQGFVDLQVNGYLGTSFTGAELTADTFRDACRKLLRNGTAAFLPTIVTSPPERFERNLSLMAPIIEEEEFAGRLLGFHVEGPFLSPEPGAIGAHPPEHARAPSIEFFEQLQSWAKGHIKVLTVAAGVPGVETLIEHVSGQGICVSLGHQLPDRAALRRAAAAGATGLTHLGNGAPNVLPRHPNPVWDGLAVDELTAMFIADGHHIERDILSVMLRGKGMERSAVVSDASSMAGMPPGEYNSLHNRIVLEPSGKLHNPDKGCLVGSAYSMRECANVLHEMGYDLASIEHLCVHQPLRLIGMADHELRPVEPLHFDQQHGFTVANSEAAVYSG